MSADNSYYTVGIAVGVTFVVAAILVVVTCLSIYYRKSRTYVVEGNLKNVADSDTAMEKPKDAGN